MVNSRIGWAVVPLLGLLAGCGTTEPLSPEQVRAEWTAAFDTNLAVQDDLIRLYRDCMEGKGFTEHPDPGMGTFDEVTDPFMLIDRVFTIAMPGREYAEVHGLSASPPEWREYLLMDGRPVVSGGADGSLNGLSHKEYGEYYEALHGYNPHLVVDESDIPNQQAVTVGDRTIHYSTAGCRFEVQDRVFDGEVEAYHEHTYLAVRGIQQGVMAALEVQSEVIAAYDDWAVCMSEAGYPGLLDVGRFRQVIVDEVWNPIADRDPQPGTPLFEDAKAEEVAMAMVHIGCDEQAGLRQTHLDTVDRLTAEYLVSHETELFAWYEMLTTARERAGELLGR